MTLTQRRQVSFAGTTLSIAYEDARITELLDFLYGHTPAASVAAPGPDYRIVVHAHTDQVTLRRDGARLYQGALDATFAEYLLGETCRQLAARSQGGMLFHAAGLGWRGKGLLLPGLIGAGKTTLAAWLLTQGLGYLSDELIFVLAQRNDMRGFARPLNLKVRAGGTFPLDVGETAGKPNAVRSTHQSALVAPTHLNPAVPLNSLPVHAIVFPHYSPDTDLVLQPLSKAQAGLRLMACLVNARNLPEHGFPEITRLAQHAPAYALHYAHFAQLEGLVERLCEN